MYPPYAIIFSTFSSNARILSSIIASFVTAIGCYRDRLNNRAMPELLASFRNNGLDWRNLDKTVIQKCKEEAAKKVR